MINMKGLADRVGASGEVMQRNMRRKRTDRPYEFTNLRDSVGVIACAAKRAAAVPPTAS